MRTRHGDPQGCTRGFAALRRNDAAVGVVLTALFEALPHAIARPTRAPDAPTGRNAPNPLARPKTLPSTCETTCNIPKTRTPFGRLLLFSAVALFCSSPIGAEKNTLLSLVRNMTVGENKHLKTGMTKACRKLTRRRFVTNWTLFCLSSSGENFEVARADAHLRRPVLHLKAREALNSLCGRARTTTRKCDVNSDAAGAE